MPHLGGLMSLSLSPKVRERLPILLYPLICLLLRAHEWHTADEETILRLPAGLALVEALKLAFSLFTRYRWPKSRRSKAEGKVPSDRGFRLDEERPREGQNGASQGFANRATLDRLAGAGGDERKPPVYMPLAATAGFLWTTSVTLYTKAVGQYETSAIFVSVALSAPLVLYALYAFCGRSASNALCQTLALQFCGILIVGSNVVSTIPLRLLALPVVTTVALVFLEVVYRIPLASFSNVNIAFFSVGFSIHVITIVLSLAYTKELWPPILAHASVDHVALVFLKATADLLAVNIIFVHDALLERVLHSLAITLALPVLTIDYGLESMRVVLGCVVSVWAALAFVLSPTTGNLSGDSLQSTTAPSRKRPAIGVVVFALLSLIAWWGPVPRGRPHSSDASNWDPALVQPNRCVRRPLSIPPLYPPNKRAYRKFDDVLLVVFFSHARYDANLDHYRAVYADYFPNIVFVGPGTRENAGFRHSYDVLVDTYQSDEDLSDDKNYRMAGRMAHHMLYTALREYPCYKGYLWAPFDTLLNVPRLEQFDQSLFWYHSPFARYVHNVALGDAEANANPARHPPPAKISPDPSVNLTVGWRGWGPDWWWGDPHVGVAECMPAFLKTLGKQRARLASYFNGETRFLGGSVDTLYIPGHHRETFMETLGLFLETNCFLEIAVPTVLHLVVPADEDILYVDHHWIWYPPFDGEFVRKQWKLGLEVDTFHTFHWGETGQDDVWRARPELIEDTRILLKQSAARQNTRLPLHKEG